MTDALTSFQHFRQAGSSLLVASTAPGAEPQVVHWGADLGDLSELDVSNLTQARLPVLSHSAYDVRRHVGITLQPSDGFAGQPAVEGFREGRRDVPVSPLFADWAVAEQSEQRVVWAARDDGSFLSQRSEIEMMESGLVRLRLTIINDGDDAYALHAVRVTLPLDPRATELLDLTGRWCRERSPQRRTMQQGSWVRESRRGRTGHDATLLMAAGVPGFGFRHGHVWAVHVAWSGDHVTYAERLPEGDAHLGGGELLAPGEVTLQPAESYTSPWLYATWSDKGLDGASARIHGWLRSRAVHPSRPRPVVLNTWEATYFEQGLARLSKLAERAAEVGVERFVLDDGWFRGRTGDTRALGDWTVDPLKWPDGMHPLVDRVKQLGMDFGLWVEPEMVNLDSDVARAHPDWVLTGREELPMTWRHQHVLDLQKAPAYDHVRDSLLQLLAEYDIAYLKWDHNRDVTDMGHLGRRAVHGQTTALYRLLDEIRAAQPDLEIESCASGGGRIDLEILQRTDRVWPSDCNDPLERQAIQRWTGLLVPPELMGAHIGAPRSHTTRRTHDLDFRALTAVFGHLGVEWDLGSLKRRPRREVAAWIAYHKRHRQLLHNGAVVRGDHPDPHVWIHGVVAEDGSEAIYAMVAMGSAETTTPVPVRLPGLLPDVLYQIELDGVVPPPAGAYLGPAGVETGPVRLHGRVVGEVGIAMPIVLPESGRLIRVTRVA